MYEKIPSKQALGIFYIKSKCSVRHDAIPFEVVALVFRHAIRVDFEPTIVVRTGELVVRPVIAPYPVIEHDR